MSKQKFGFKWSLKRFGSIGKLAERGIKSISILVETGHAYIFHARYTYILISISIELQNII